jgi:hypothetical protein
MDPDPDPEGPKTHGSDGYGSGFATLVGSKRGIWQYLSVPNHEYLTLIYGSGSYSFLET